MPHPTATAEKKRTGTTAELRSLMILLMTDCPTRRSESLFYNAQKLVREYYGPYGWLELHYFNNGTVEARYGRDGTRTAQCVSGPISDC